MRIAAAQILSGRDPQDNLRQVRERVAEAAARGARIVVFPEATMRAFGAGRLDEIAEPLDGPWPRRWRRSRGSTGSSSSSACSPRTGRTGPQHPPCHRTCGARCGSPGGDLSGDLHLGYDKIHLFDAFDSPNRHGLRRDTTHVISVDGVGIGLSVCYDIRFPGQYRRLAAEGARLTLCSASWGSGPARSTSGGSARPARSMPRRSCSPWTRPTRPSRGRGQEGRAHRHRALAARGARRVGA